MSQNIYKPQILFFCPLPPPIGGQAAVSRIVYNLIKPSYLINTNIRDKYYDTFIIFIKTIYIMLSKKIDLVYFTCTRSKVGAIKDIVLLAFCKYRNIKVLNHLHGNEIGDLFTGGIISKILVNLYQSIDTTIFVMEKQKELMPSIFASKKRIAIPNSYDPEMDKIKIEKYYEGGNVNLLFISFIMMSKGIFEALSAFDQLACIYPDISFSIAGEPRADEFMALSQVELKFNSELERLKKKYPGRVKYHGVATGEKKIKLFQDSDILLFPTFFKTESFGIVNVEGMRTGNVIISTRHNNISEVVSQREGRLVSPNNVDGLCEAIKVFLDDHELMINTQKHNISHAKKYYSPSLFKSSIQSVFNEYLIGRSVS